ncbi:MAG: N-acetylmuramoyl-L-alanine amidase [Acidobacteria bacterium]|nr:N-acetylmuramoyl-L-alanine amidase [Acidobacteriota bacterium]
MAIPHLPSLAWTTCLLGLVSLVAPPDALAQSARTRYESALIQEQQLRERLDAAERALAPERSSAVREAQRIVALYQALVRRYPASAYSDNALWQAAELNRTLFHRFAREESRQPALRAYQQLITEYPSSSLLRKAQSAVESLDPRVMRSLPTDPAAPAPPRTQAGPASAPAVTASSPAPSSAPGPAPEPRRATLTRIERTVLPETVRITLFIDREVDYREERITGPSRVFLDLKGVGVAPALRDASFQFEEDVVRHIRVGRHPNSTVRVVLDSEGVARYSAYPLYNPFRIVIDCERVSTPERAAEAGGAAVAPPSASPERRAAPTAARTAPVTRVPVRMDPEPIIAPETDALPAARWETESAAAPALKVPAIATPPETVARKPAPAPRVETPTKPAVMTVPSRETAPAAVPPAPPVANSVGGFSIARQLGLGASRIVIDPGHGGRDPGAGVRELNEAELTLDVALRLEKLLQQEPGIDTVLTRRSDVYVSLEERTAIANRENADLFLSIHANASRNVSARGVETYILSFASSAEAEAVAARENAGSDRTMHNLPDIIKAIALNNKLDESRDLARMVQESLVSRLRRVNSGVRDLGVKKAPFVVLIGAGMPSVLAEISFLTHKQDAQLLKTSAYRQRIAEALHAAVLRYRRSLKGSGKVTER